MQAPQHLYCYDDDTLYQYTDYCVETTIAGINTEPYDFVLVTFDGATCRSAEGAQLLQQLGDIIRPCSTTVIIGGVGIGLREHFLQTMQLPSARIMQGSLGMLSHQVTANTFPLHPPTDPNKLRQASLAFHHFSNKVGFIIVAAPKKRAQQFASIYNHCGVSRCKTMSAGVYNILSNVFYPFFAACEIAGWPGTHNLTNDKELWSLCCRAQNEIVGLGEHGWLGKLIALLMSERWYLKILLKLERESLPLDLHAFNHFHHGHKVLAQDIQIMENCVKAGQSQGQPMGALQDILNRLDRHQREISSV
jgi:hypothetical protein